MTDETRICRGPTHTAPTAIPLTTRYWYFHKTGERAGKPLAQCIECSLYKKTGKIGNAGRPIDGEKLEDLVRELVNRMGMSEASRFSGISATTLRAMKTKTHGRFQKRIVHKLILAVDQARREGIMRHKKSIRHGAAQRGEATVKPHSKKMKLNGETKRVKVPETKRRAPRERRVVHVSDQYGPVYPHLEQELREAAARRRRERRANDSELRIQENRSGMLSRYRRDYGAERAQWEIRYYDLKLSPEFRAHLRSLTDEQREAVLTFVGNHYDEERDLRAHEKSMYENLMACMNFDCDVIAFRGPGTTCPCCKAAGAFLRPPTAAKPEPEPEPEIPAGLTYEEAVELEEAGAL